MNFRPCSIPDVLLIESKKSADDRGYFMELFRADIFSDRGPPTTYVQDSESLSTFGVVRGLHYQLPPFAQTKIVHVVVGRVIDVAVDIRRGSPTFGEHVALELSSDNQHQLLIPRGFAHGFVVLSKDAILSYKVDNYYAPEAERGIVYNDPALAIDWRLDPEIIRTSVKDGKYPALSKAELSEPGHIWYD